MALLVIALWLAVVAGFAIVLGGNRQ